MSAFDTISSVFSDAGEAVQDGINAWLDLGGTPVGGALHIAAMLALQVGFQELSNLTTAGGKMHMHDVTNSIGLTNLMPPTALKIFNDILRQVLYPNIEGIIIFADRETSSRKMDVSEQVMVVQKKIGSSTYIMDNAVPHPREWSISGYLTTVLPIDHGLLVKPSILLQKSYIDMCMKSRRPVWFKSHDLTFTRVLISSFDATWDPKMNNALQVSLQLKEYVPFEVTTSAVPEDVMKKIATYPL